jgi:hypothetical protein
MYAERGIRSFSLPFVPYHFQCNNILPNKSENVRYRALTAFFRADCLQRCPLATYYSTVHVPIQASSGKDRNQARCFRRTCRDTWPPLWPGRRRPRTCTGPGGCSRRGGILLLLLLLLGRLAIRRRCRPWLRRRCMPWPLWLRTRTGRRTGIVCPSFL